MQAQEKVTSYFQSRKRPSGLQPSKRRKVLRNADIDSVITQVPQNETKTPDSTPLVVKSSSKTGPLNPVLEHALECTQTAGRSARRKTVTSQGGGRRTRAKKKLDEGPSACKITDLFPKVDETELALEPAAYDEVDGPCPDPDGEKSSCPAVAGCPKTKIYEIASAFIDDHAITPPASPQKRQSVENVDVVSEAIKKRCRPHKSAPKDRLLESLQRTPETGYNFSSSANKKQTNFTAPPSVRKKLVLTAKEKEDSCQTPVKTPTKTEKQVVEAQSTPLRNKVLKNVEKSLSKKSKDISTKSGDSKLKIDGKMMELESLKLSLKSKKVCANPAEMKSKLAKCGKLADLQEQLAKLNDNVKKVEKAKEKSRQHEKEKEEEEKKPKDPAYQRYHALAQPVAPTLVLPYKYKLLNEMFRSTDTVVSMLHNRSEICTFNKLKAAVQNMVRRAFESKTLGQIRKVFPAAYQFRQEKGLPQFGGKSNEYQMTVEASLDQEAYNECLETVLAKNEEETKKKKQAKKTFAATSLLDRRNIFHRNLVDIVKQNHREFLSKLDCPLSVPDDKLTRWHPKFNVDGVPDVEPAPLPEAPNIQKFVSAQDVMHHTSGKLPKRVELALAKVAAASKEIEEKVNKPEKKTDDDRALKGVSQSLLDRIRSKEAKKTELAMTRTSADDRHLEMLSRLPNLVRILRTIFVTEKKPAVPLDVACGKMADSYKSGISVGEIEKHVDLMVKLLPEWVKIVKTIKGKFVKVDKNQDIGIVVEKVQKILKEKQS